MTQPHPLQQARRVLADVREAADDVVQVEVAEGGVVLALPPHLHTNGWRSERRPSVPALPLKGPLEPEN